MPYKNIVFAKLEKRLQNDPRWYMMSEEAQLNYVKLILLACETYNKIPKNILALKKAFKTDQDLETIEATIKEIKKNFVKFRENKYIYYFKDFHEKTNYIPTRAIQRKSQVLPKEATDKEEEEDKEEEKDKEEEEYSKLADFLLRQILERKPTFKKPNIKDWAKHIELMIRIDKRKPNDILNVILWCQSDPFWQNNILSTAKLRKQFDQLELKMKAEPKPFSAEDLK